MLANIYLHYVLDLWFEKCFARQCRGKAFLVRYADDYIVCFQYEGDAKQFHRAMIERLAQFDLEVEPSKTAILRFGSTALRNCSQGYRKASTFSFLGFTHYVGRSRTGQFVVGRKTDGKRKRKKLQALNAKLRALRGEGGREMVAHLRRHLRGHIQYYGVSGNSRGVARRDESVFSLAMMPQSSVVTKVLPPISSSRYPFARFNSNLRSR